MKTLLAPLALLLTLCLVSPLQAQDAMAKSGGLDKETYEELARHAYLDPATAGQFLQHHAEKAKALQAFDKKHGQEMRQLRAQVQRARQGQAAPETTQATPAEPAPETAQEPGLDLFGDAAKEQPAEQPAEAAAPAEPALSTREAYTRYRQLLRERYAIARQHDGPALKLIPRRYLDSFRAVMMWKELKPRFAPAHLNQDQQDQAILVCERVLGVSRNRGNKSPAQIAYDTIVQKILTRDQRQRLVGVKPADPTASITAKEKPKDNDNRNLGFEGSARSEGGGGLGDGGSLGGNDRKGFNNRD